MFGIGIELQGLVPKKLFGNIRYNEPIEKSNNVATLLKHEMKCDYVIALSHLGYQHEHNKVSDVVLVENTENIDVLLGGHTHTFMNEPAVLKNKNGKEVIINQVVWAGLVLGKIDIIFDENRKQKVKNFSQKKN